MVRLSNLRSASILAIFAAAVGVPLCVQAATINFPPPGSNAFISAYEIDSGLSVCPQVQCNIISSPGAPLTMDPTTFEDASHLNVATVEGSITATAMHSKISSNHPGIEYDLAMNDTYTVHGTATGVVPITVTFAASGTAESALLTGTTNIILGEGVVLKIGTLDLNPAGLIPNVDPSASANNTVGTLIQSAPFSVPFSTSASFTEDVSVGQVFDLAYELTSGIVIGGVDLSHTATISFDLPDGVFLTSAAGATFGDVPSTGAVPEPSLLFPLGLGLAGLVWARRRFSVPA
jgi:PEP-CTERM motif